MKRFPIETGSIVISTAGRDEGRRLLVVEELDENFVLAADGALRPIEKPKKKRRKHLKATGKIVEPLLELKDQGKSALNHEIRAWLKVEEEENLVQV